METNHRYTNCLNPVRRVTYILNIFFIYWQGQLSSRQGQSKQPQITDDSNSNIEIQVYF